MNEKQNKIAKLLWDFQSLREEHILKVVAPETIRKFYEFLSGKELLEHYAKLEHYTNFDIIFLDIRMEGGINGGQIAKIIHSQVPDALISFYTAYDYPSSRVWTAFLCTGRLCGL